MHRLLPIVTASILLGVASAASASPLQMQKLPASNPFRCLNCHTTQDPVASTADLNSFGRDFQANGHRWDAILARLNSDSDSCTNGFEIGDQDGDGRLDVNVNAERHNPGAGDQDCTLQLNQEAWTALKKLFR
jgi:hypothetical protein